MYIFIDVKKSKYTHNTYFGVTHVYISGVFDVFGLV